MPYSEFDGVGCGVAFDPQTLEYRPRPERTPETPECTAPAPLQVDDDDRLWNLPAIGVAGLG